MFPNPIGAAPFVGNTVQPSNPPAPAIASRMSWQALPQTAPHLPLSVAADLRFGGNAYIRRDAGTVLRGQVSAMAPVSSAGVAVQVVLVNLCDIGFSSHRRGNRTNGLPQAMPTAGPGWNSLLPDVGLLPSRMQGRLVRLPDRAGDAIVEFVRVKLAWYPKRSVFDDIRWLPFSSFQDTDGALIGVLQLGSGCYRFRAASIQSGNPEDRNLVHLRPTSPLDIGKYRSYQNLWLHLRTPAPDSRLFLGSLGDAAPLLRQRFAATLERAEAILFSAISMFSKSPKIALAICARFSQAPDDPVEVQETFNAVRQNLKAEASAFPLLLRQAAHVAGFFRCAQGGRQGVGQERATCMTIRNSMQYPLDFTHIGGVLLAFNVAYFNAPATLLDNLAALLLHHYSHALIGTTDLTPAAPGRGLFAEARHSCYELQPLMDASREPGHAAAFHAASLEHITMLLAYWRDPATRASTATFLQGASSYQRLYSERDFDEITADVGAS